MIKGFEKMPRLGQSNTDSAMHMFDECNRNWYAIAAEMGDYTKRSLEEGSATLERLMGSKSVGHAIEIQASYANRTYEDCMQQVTKIGGMYANMARVAFEPVGSSSVVRKGKRPSSGE